MGSRSKFWPKPRPEPTDIPYMWHHADADIPYDFRIFIAFGLGMILGGLFVLWLTNRTVQHVHREVNGVVIDVEAR